MKKITLLLILIAALISCNKQNIIKPKSGEGMDVSATVNGPLIFDPVIKSDLILTTTGTEVLTYNPVPLVPVPLVITISSPSGGLLVHTVTYTIDGKSMSLLNTLKPGIDSSTYTVTSMDKSVVYYSASLNPKGVMTSTRWYNTPPMGNVLPTPAYLTWAGCMGVCIRTCLNSVICNSWCNREAIIGCMGGWAVYCIFHKE